MELSRGIALVVIGLVALVAKTAHADDEKPARSIEDETAAYEKHADEVRGIGPPARIPRDRSPEEPPLSTAGGWEFTLTPMTFATSLGSTSFRARPQPIGFGKHEAFNYRGAAMGLDAPRFWGGEVRLAYLRRHVRIGGMAFYARAPGGADAEARLPNAAAHAVTEGLNAWGGAADLALVIPIDPITISVGGLVGGRAFYVPITGYEPTMCKASRSQRRSGVKEVPCEVEASTNALFFAQPQARVDIALGEGGWAFLGVYGGIDLVSRGESFGLVLGLRTPHGGLAW